MGHRETHAWIALLRYMANVVVTCFPGDMFKDDLPEADLYVLAHVIHNWDDDRIDTIMKKLYKALPPGE